MNAGKKKLPGGGPQALADDGAAPGRDRRRGPRLKDYERTGEGSATALARLKMLERKVLGKK